jgi:hypothetical protein
VDYLSQAAINLERCPFDSVSLGQAGLSSTRDVNEVCVCRTSESNRSTPHHSGPLQALIFQSPRHSVFPPRHRFSPSVRIRSGSATSFWVM